MPSNTAVHPVVPVAPAVPPVAEEINPYAMETIVNNVSDELDTIFHTAFEIQDVYENETKFRVAFFEGAAKHELKQLARSAVSQYDREVDSWSKEHPKLTREQCEASLLETKPGKAFRKMRDAALVVVKK